LAEQRSLMGVYAHPDDEQGASGSLIKYGQMGVRTTLVTATRGEAGEIAPGVNATPENLGEVREREMRCAAETIGVNKLYFLDYCDSGMAGTPENASPLSFHQAPLLNVAEKVTRLVRQERPQVIMTFDPWGGYGHPDHIKIHQAALVAYFVAGDPRAYPEQIREEGLTPWTPLKLYYGAFSQSRFQKYLDLLQARGETIPEMLQGLVKRALPDELITTEIDVAPLAERKLQALLCHASQLGPDTLFAKLPVEFQHERMWFETFILAESRLGRPLERETDLFAGVT
jgi:LmbE family N-acetylglucosaminyl deacetylase